jgi:hypothetical protein
LINAIQYRTLKHIALENVSLGCIGAGSIFGFFIFSAVAKGFKNILLMDGDRFEISNLPKNPWLHPADDGISKVEFWKNKIHLMEEDVALKSCDLYFEDGTAHHILETSDIIILCVDNNRTRIKAQLFCIEQKKPLLDAASGIYADEQGNIIESGMRIKVYVPGGPCLYCQGTRVGTEESELLRNPGSYVIGSPQTRDTSINLNQAAGSLMSTILCKLCRGDKVPVEIRYDELQYELFTVSHSISSECELCMNT